MIHSLGSTYSSLDTKYIFKMICRLKFIFAWILLIPQFADGGNVTWHEPTPVETALKPDDVLIPGKLKIREGSSAALTWSYSLSSSLVSAVLKFNGSTIVAITSNGKAGPVNPNFRQRFEVSSTPQSVSLLSSKVTTADDDSIGDFICELLDLNGVYWRRAIQLQVIVPLNITGIRGEPTVLEGDNLQLTCEASSRIEPTITWTKEKPGNQGNNDVVQKGEVLNLPNINRTYSGTFTCIADNGFGKQENRTVYVNVTYSAKIGKFQPEYIVVIQQSLTLNCQAEGNPPPTHTWTPCDREQVCDKNTLDISQVHNDASYTCRVANVYGSDSKTANVYIGGNVINITIVITSEICTDGKYNQSLLLEILKKPVDEAFADKPGYEGVQLLGVRCGSIIAYLALKFNSTTKEKDVIITLNGAVKEGKLGKFSIGAIKGTRPDVEPTHGGITTPPDGSSVGIAWWIIFIIGLAVVIVLGLLVIILKKTGRCPPLSVKNGKHPRVHSDEGRGIATEADNQYAAAGPNVNYRASNPSTVPSVTYEVANRSSEGRRGNNAGAPREQLSEYAVVD